MHKDFPRSGHITGFDSRITSKLKNKYMDGEYYILTFLGIMRVKENSELFEICNEKGLAFRTLEEAKKAELEIRNKNRQK